MSNTIQRWVPIYNHFTPRECNGLIETVMEEVEPTPPNTGGLGYNQTIRECDLRWLSYEDPRWQSLRQKIWQIVQQHNRVYFNVDVQEIFEMQFTTYIPTPTKAAHYDWHEDCLYNNDRRWDRKLSLVFNLSDPSDYEGGELVVNPGIHGPIPTDIRQQGNGIIFYSNLQHKVRPVTKGIRHSLVVWVEGPHWR